MNELTLSSAQIDADRETVAKLMPELLADHRDLVAIPSCAFPSYPTEPVHQAASHIRDLLQQAGVSDVRLESVNNGMPVILGEVPGPAGSPTILLYAHYDVQPAPAEQNWKSDPWIATTKDDGRIYGRGAADDKGGVAIHLGTIRALAADPPATLRVIIEGEEEIGSPNFEQFVREHLEYVQADAVIICDSGNQRAGVPAITTGLRGMAACNVTITTLDRAGHSGLFGGAAPDALITLVRLIATLHDNDGNVAVAGLHQFEWQGAEVDEQQFRVDAGLISNETPLTGSGSIASRLWSRPSITVIGMDVPPSAGTPNALVPTASAKLSMRVAPGADTEHELGLLIDHLQSHTPSGINIEITRLEGGAGYLADDSTPVMQLAFNAISAAYEHPAGALGSGGSIPAVALFKELCPSITPILWGPEDSKLARIHASDESVDPSEIEKITLTQVLFARALASGK